MEKTNNLELLARYNALWSWSGLENAAQVIHPKFIRHGSSGSFEGLTAFRKFVAHFLRAFPDIRFTVDDCILETNRVALRYRFTATHRDAFLGIPRTDKRIKISGSAIYKIVDDKVQEIWDFMDMLELLEQFGRVPFPLEMPFLLTD